MLVKPASSYRTRGWLNEETGVRTTNRSQHKSVRIVLLHNNSHIPTGKGRGDEGQKCDHSSHLVGHMLLWAKGTPQQKLYGSILDKDIRNTIDTYFMSLPSEGLSLCNPSKYGGDAGGLMRWQGDKDGSGTLREEVRQLTVSMPDHVTLT